MRKRREWNNSLIIISLMLYLKEQKGRLKQYKARLSYELRHRSGLCFTT